MIFNKNENIKIYNLPSIKYFYKSEYNINDKIYDLYENKRVQDLLENIGYDINKIKTPSNLLGIENNDTVFYNEIELYDNIKNEHNKIIFMYFYTSQYDKYKSSIFYNNIKLKNMTKKRNNKSIL